jgi:glycosyltransferase involved in cell wall biosynthesis
MMSNPLISIIIPTYNRAHLIGETLDSVMAQTYTNWECIVVDDGSTDTTDEVLENYVKKDNRFQYFKRPNDRPKGANACRNYGFEVSKGEYILFLDSDDFLELNCLKNRTLEFIKDPILNLVISNTSFFYDGQFQTKLFNKNINNLNQQEYLILFLSYKIPWTIMSVLWERNTISNIKFDPNLFRLQDIDFAISVLQSKKLNLKRINQLDTFYRKEKIKQSQQSFLKISESVLLSLQVFINKTNTNKHLTTEKKYFKRFLIILLFKYYYPNFKYFENKFNSIEKQLFTNFKLNLIEIIFFSIKKIMYIKGYNKIDKRYFWMMNQYCDKILKLK